MDHPSMEAVVMRWLNLRSHLALHRPCLFLLFLGALPLSPFHSAQLKPICGVLILNDLGLVPSPDGAEVDQPIFASPQKSPYQLALWFGGLALTVPNESSEHQFGATSRDRAKWFWLGALVIVLSLAGLVAYLHYSRLQLQQARAAEVHLAGMVINAQETERSRLAAELHDDFGQRLALLIVGLEDAAESLPPSAFETKRKLDELAASVGDLGDDLHTLSHRLHSATLDKLGLVTGLRALCDEFTGRHGIDVSLCSDGVPPDVPSDVALCLFRIAQESLQNIKKHSQVFKAQVKLALLEDSLLLCVTDEGRGFDAHEAKQRAGLGLRSMEGRALLLGGQLRIRSAAGKGTRIEAIVPLEPASGRNGEPSH